MEFKFGCDPEIFVKNSRGNLVSAHGMVPGNKKAPHKVTFGAVQVDGMALEFNINPVRNRHSWVGHINNVLSEMKEMIPSSYKFDYSPVAHFGEEMIKSQPEEARILGCDPDFNVYTGEANPTPDGNKPFRTASGHIHIGWTDKEDVNDPGHIEACQMVVKQLDMSLGEFENWWCEPNERRELYGKVGTYRVKPYGVEYRVLNNSWLRSNKLKYFVYDVTEKSVEDLMDGRRYYEGVRHKYWLEDHFSPAIYGNFGAEMIRGVINRVYHNEDNQRYLR